MKEFNLEEAKKGNPVCTRDGRKARILCFDLKSGHYTIAAAVEVEGCERVLTYTRDGHYNISINEYSCDLMMAIEKHEGWVNLYKSPSAIEEGNYPYFGEIYETEEEAKRNKDSFYIATIKIEWEE